ncbi:MAG: GntR family transcriptional regulator [Pseudomonadota bacterium]
MAQKGRKPNRGSASARIADSIRSLILGGSMSADEKLPGEQELAARFGVSRPTVREALKRLAAQNLIRTRRGAAGGSFVNRVGLTEAQDQLVATAVLLISMADIPAAKVAEARLVLLAAVAPLACERRAANHLDQMRAEIVVQRDAATTDEEFCASDVRFHRALADAAGNPFLAFQMAGVIEAVQPLLNMVTWRGRDRAVVAARHARITAMLDRRDVGGLCEELRLLSDYTLALVREAQATTAKREMRNAQSG